MTFFKLSGELIVFWVKVLENNFVMKYKEVLNNGSTQIINEILDQYSFLW